MAVFVPSYTSATKVQSKTGLGNSDVDLSDDDILRAVIEDAEEELESVCGRKFTDANSITEYFSIKDEDVIGNKQSSLVLRQHPILSITSFTVLDTDGNASSTFDTLSAAEIIAGTFESDDYWVLISIDPLSQSQVPDGRIKMKTDTFPEGTNNVKVSYSYGYSGVPIVVANLATCLAGIRAWVYFLGGQYNAITSYNIPEQGVVKGELYQRGKIMIELLTEEANRLYERIGRRKAVSFFSSGGVR